MRKLIFLNLLLSILIFNTGYAQFNINWTAPYAHTTSFNFSNESRKLVKDGMGKLYVLSDVTSDVDINGVQGGQTYHYTVLNQYDNAGNLIKSRVIDVANHMTSGFDNPGAFGLEFDNSGFIYIGFNTYNPNTGYNVSITKYKTAGLTRLWTYNFNPSTTDQGVDLKIGANGTAFGIVKSVNGANTQYHIVKSDTSGTSSTPFFSFDQNLDFLNSMVVNSSNEVFVTGYRWISSVKNALTAGVKPVGTIKWKKTYNGGTIIRDDSGKHIILGTNNNVYVCGTSDRGTPNLNDVMVLSYVSADGRFEWVSYIDYNTTNDNGIIIRQADASNLYVGAISNNTNTVVMSRIKMMFGTKTGQGIYTPIPTTGYSSINSITLNEMVVSGRSNLYFTGNVLATDLSGQSISASYLVKFLPVPYRTNINDALKLDFDFPVNGNLGESYTSTDLILDESISRVYLLRDRIQPFSTHAREIVDLIAYSIPAPNRIGSEISSSDNIELTIFPNPASDRIQIVSNEPMATIELIDNLGRTIKNVTVTDDFHADVELAKYQDGIYTLLIHSLSGTVESRQFIKSTR